MIKNIKIGAHVVPMKASALTAYKYKEYFGRDIIKDVQALGGGDVDAVFISRFAWILARGANADIEPFEAWLENFEFFDVIEALPEMLEFWGLNTAQASTPKKK